MTRAELNAWARRRPLPFALACVAVLAAWLALSRIPHGRLIVALASLSLALAWASLPLDASAGEDRRSLFMRRR